MELRDDTDEFQRSLEPMVIIDDEETTEESKTDTHSDTNPSPIPLKRSITPEISIIPVPHFSTKRTKPQIKLKLFDHQEFDSKQRKSSPLEKCPICKKYFRRMKTHLLKHEMISRAPEDRLMCPFCQKAFNTQSNLAIHMRTHTGDKPYVCDVCKKSFSQSCNLVNHLRVHTGEKPFKCPYCDRAFTQSGNLHNHIRLHTDEKPFKCHFCDKAFVQSGNLSSHIRNNHKYLDDSIESVARRTGDLFRGKKLGLEENNITN